ncbi:glucose dehydrogenase [FAD, quinone]-like [Epargyreus clarus]|uniref:glucose dehydrogenase [FAD, quinone]-like n=1 Tax=Epargyreus clarus TaxID=520877 RepID=UPI003C301765
MWRWWYRSRTTEPFYHQSIICVFPASPHDGAVFDAITGFLADAASIRHEEPADADHIDTEYDFVIIGAGSAGCVLSNRLTEVKHFNVLLIEAGDSEQAFMDIPVIATMMQFTDANWDYQTEPQKAGCMGMRHGRCSWPRGKVVGGSSVLHSMMHTRGNRKDYDRWAANGNPGWDFKSALKYFKKSENLDIPELAKNKIYHSRNGPLTIEYPKWRTPLSDAFLKAGVETGAKIVDYNGETQTGYSIIQFTTSNGTRVSASRAFLHPITNRKNFHITKNSFVTKILIDPWKKKAYGVEFRKDGKKFVVIAKREVILSAGAINSPQILMISGIGPKEHLTEKNISTIVDLPVGYNLQDHWALGGLTFIINTTDSIRFERVATLRNIIKYYNQRSGPLTAPTGTEAIAFIDTKNPKNDDGYPDLELLFVAGSLVSQSTYKHAFAIDDYIYETVYDPIADMDTWMVFPMILLPKSRGRIMLKSKNPYKKPLIYANYFSDGGHDEKVILYGIRKTIELSKTEAFQKYGSRLHDIPIPNCAHLRFNSDAYWICAMKTLTVTIYHHCCTNKMGPKTDPEAVVDSRLKVYGIRGLRVVDASVMPHVPAAHTNAPTIMIAEKAADLIKEDWGIPV